MQGYPCTQATLPGSLDRANLIPFGSAPLFGLAPGGVYHAVPVTRSAVSSYLTFSPLPERIRAVSFLWHFPSRHRDWELPSALPFGARTFLPDESGRPPEHLSLDPEKKSGELPGRDRLVKGHVGQCVRSFVLLPWYMLKRNPVESTGELHDFLIKGEKTRTFDFIAACNLPDHKFRIGPNNHLSNTQLTSCSETRYHCLIFRNIVGPFR